MTYQSKVLFFTEAENLLTDNKRARLFEIKQETLDNEDIDNLIQKSETVFFNYRTGIFSGGYLANDTLKEFADLKSAEVCQSPNGQYFAVNY